MAELKRKKYVVARNPRKRQMAIHRISELNEGFTECGCQYDVWPWRVYLSRLSSEIGSVLMCRRCDRNQPSWDEFKS